MGSVELESAGVETTIHGVVTTHDSTNGFIYYRIGEAEKCTDDHVVRPSGKYLPKGQRIKITFLNLCAVTIEADDT